jgi:hypothetical protein
VPLGNALDALSSYVGSSYITQINKFHRVFQIYLQAEAAARVQTESLTSVQFGRPRLGPTSKYRCAHLPFPRGSLRQKSCLSVSGYTPQSIRVSCPHSAC